MGLIDTIKGLFGGAKDAAGGGLGSVTDKAG
ncbi:MAG: hypothetical protein ACI8TP_004497, partial [Acidimicrobiales bacterium]